MSRIRAVRAGMRRGRGYYMVPALPAAGLPALRVAGSGCISPTEARRSRSVIDIRRAGCTTDNSWSPSMHVMPGKAPHVGHSQRSSPISDTDAHPPITGHSVIPSPCHRLVDGRGVAETVTQPAAGAGLQL